MYDGVGTMAEIRISIGQVKRDISELVNRVAYRGERIVLTSRGKPKAALVSIEDYERLRQAQQEEFLVRWEEWKAECDALNERILKRRQGQPLDIEALWRAAREDLEARSDWLVGH